MSPGGLREQARRALPRFRLSPFQPSLTPASESLGTSLVIPLLFLGGTCLRADGDEAADGHCSQGINHLTRSLPTFRANCTRKRCVGTRFESFSRNKVSCSPYYCPPSHVNVPP
ncbi:hypothetical protein BC567DRAFT_235481 [Phyllosticta citribraziliensis]